MYKRQRDYTRFLWYFNVDCDKWPNSKIIEYRFCRLPFGFRSSPFVLNKILQHHLQLFKASFPSTVSKIKNNLYVDDLIISSETKAELTKTINETKEIFANMSMNMHKWHSNTEEYNSDNDCKILGVKWDIKQDMLSINIPPFLPLQQKEN